MFQSFSWLFDLVPTGSLFINPLCTCAWCSMAPSVLYITHQGPAVLHATLGHCSLAEAVPWSLAPTSVQPENTGNVIPVD